ncbi:MAG: hypothetical protein HFF54_09035, partial [Lawsonibacter sp.]|nr:hypothetical protein [Lawsonibacter sp.]
GVAVPAGKTLTIGGTISADGAITTAGDGAVVIDDATVNADVDLTGAADATLGTATVKASKTVSVDDVTLTGEITLEAGATLDISGTVTLGADAEISAVEGAKIVVGEDANVSALAGITGVKFYDAEGHEIPAPTRARATASFEAGTYVYGEVPNAAEGTKGFVLQDEGGAPDPGAHEHNWGAYTLDSENNKHVRTCSGTGECDATAADKEHAVPTTEAGKVAGCAECDKLTFPATHEHSWGAYTLDSENNKHVRTCSGTGECDAVAADKEHAVPTSAADKVSGCAECDKLTDLS